MTQITHSECIDAVSGVGTTSRIVACDDSEARYVRIAYRLDSSVATFAGTITILGGADGNLQSMYPLTTAALMSPAVAGAALSNGVITFSTVAIGTAYGLLSVNDPPPFVAVTHVFTSGGGTNRLRVKVIF